MSKKPLGFSEKLRKLGELARFFEGDEDVSDDLLEETVEFLFTASDDEVDEYSREAGIDHEALVERVLKMIEESRMQS